MGEGADGLLRAATLQQWCECAASNLEVAAGRISFNSSGSTGAPKSCVHQLNMLWQEALFFAGQLPQAQRILHAVPAHHIYGFLFTVLLPLATQATLLDARPMLPATLLRHASPGDVIVAYPGYWQAVAMAAPLAWPTGVTGVTSTAPCPPELAQQLADSGLRLLEVYGSSETAGVGWRSDARQPYTLLPYWQRNDAAGAGPDVLLRQAGDDAQQRSDCQDLLDWRGDRTFVPAGRRDQAVQVGGVNVYPAQVAALLRQHPGVCDAQVRLMRADEGQRLKAYVVPADDADHLLLADDLTRWVRSRLPAAARPVSFTIGAVLPRNHQGKPSDWIIADQGER
jgi:4-coumarate--CoA ligase (photoactive yellow protein activation family)